MGIGARNNMINAYMVDPLTIVKWNGNDTWGEPLSGSFVDVKGYIEWKTRLVRNLQGEEVVSGVTVMLHKKIDKAAYLGRALCHEDRIQIGGEDFDRAIIEIRAPKDFSHPHYEVYLA
jgi:hypothetical protein